MGKTNDESRRRFLKTAGAAAFTLGAAAAGCIDEDGGDDPGGPGDGYTPPRNPKLDYDDFVYSSCGICMVKCGMKVYRKNGKAVFIEGNPADPFSGGHLCPKGKAALGFMNNPDRLLYPLKRTNTAAKGFGVDPEWEQITWDQAYALIIDAMQSACGADFAKGEQFALVSHGEYGYCKRLLQAIGSPNMVSHYDTCFSTTYVARKALLGDNPWTNLAGADYILSFGWDQPDRSKNHPTAQFIDAVAAGAKVVCFNPYRGTVGAKATEWIPIKPGTDLAVMLAMIRRILTQASYNTDAVARTNYQPGLFETQINDGLGTGSSYDAAWAETISGVPAATINRIADEFAAASKAILPIHKRDGGTGPNYKNSFHAAHAAIILNLLVGAVDRVGGDACMAWGWAPKATLSYDENPPAAQALKALINTKGSIDGKHEFPLVTDLTIDRGIFANFADRVIAENKPYPLKMAMFRRYGLLSFPNPKKVATALSEHVDYVVFIDTMPKEIMWFADLVLPEPMFLESSGISARSFCTPNYEYVLSKQKVQNAPAELRSMKQILMDLGALLDLIPKAVDDDPPNPPAIRATTYFTNSDTDLPVTTTDDKEAMAADVDESGATVDEIVNAFEGIYHHDGFEDHQYPGTKGPFQIYSTLMATALPPSTVKYDPLPMWVEKAASPDVDYPFYLLLKRWPGLKHSAPLTSDNKYSLDAFPGPVAILHPSAAAGLNIMDGDTVCIESETGSMTAQAKVSKGIRPDCVMTNHNYGHTVNSPLGELEYRFSGQGDGALIADRAEADALSMPRETFPGSGSFEPRGDWSAGARMSDVCVKVYKAYKA